MSNLSIIHFNTIICSINYNKKESVIISSINVLQLMVLDVETRATIETDCRKNQ